MQKSPLFYVAAGYLLALFTLGILVMIVPQLRPLAIYQSTGGEMGGPEVCGNGADDDMDGAVDCADADCADYCRPKPASALSTSTETTSPGSPTEPTSPGY